MRNITLGLIAAFCVLAGCGGAPPDAAKKEEKPEPVSGRTAIYRMYAAARAWAADAQVLRAASLHIAEAPDGPPASGTAAAWSATFTSAAKSQSRTFTYSIVESTGNLHKDVFAGQSESWSGSGGSTPFLILAMKVDTDAAYKTALSEPASKAAEYDKRNPGKPITYLLERDTKHPDPVWRVVWGESASTSNFSVVIDASTGQYLETLR